VNWWPPVGQHVPEAAARTRRELMVMGVANVDTHWIASSSSSPSSTPLPLF